MLRWMIVACALSVSAPALGQQRGCATIADPMQRLACFDQAQVQAAQQGAAGQAPASQPPGAARPQAAAPVEGGACTIAAPCIGPRGGRYYFTASGAKRYLPRN